MYVVFKNANVQDDSNLNKSCAADINRCCGLHVEPEVQTPRESWRTVLDVWQDNSLAVRRAFWKHSRYVHGMKTTT